MARGPLELPVNVEDWGNRATVTVTIGPVAAAEWLLRLCLLRYGLLSSLTMPIVGGGWLQVGESTGVVASGYYAVAA